jgi:peptidoglycan/xylan/chitin deacetylase (PgdA/CDA1 family)
MPGTLGRGGGYHLDVRRLADSVLARTTRWIERHLPGRAGVLAYHRIGDTRWDPWQLSVSTAHFDDHLSVLQRLGRVLPLVDVLGSSALRRARSGVRQFAITFDDGYADNLRDALPALERHGAAATVFIAPGLLDQPSYWWDVLAEWSFGAGRSAREVAGAAAATGLLRAERVPELAGAGVEAVHGEIYQALVRLPLDEVRPLLDLLAAASGVDAPQPPCRPMTTPELLELASHPLITIGVHTVTHPRLTELTDDAVRREIVGADAQLAELLGPSPRVLAYPYGAVSPTVARIAGSAGFSHAVTTEARLLGMRDDPLLVPRLGPRDVDGAVFEDWFRRAA